MAKKDDATQKGVSDDEQDGAADDASSTTEAQSTPMSTRDAGMEMMEARRREQLASEGVELEPDPEADKDRKDGAGAADVDTQIEQQTGKDAAATIEAAERAAADEAAAAAAAGGSDRIVVVDGRQMVRTKVDGREELEPLDRVLAQYQKDKAADARLEEATRILAEARTEREKATDPNAKAKAEKKVAEAEGDLNAVKAKFFDAVYEGDSENAKKALDQIIEESVTAHLKGRDTATSDEELVARVTPAVEQSLEAKSALRKFQQDYKQIAFDPYLAAKADTFLKEALADGKTSYEAALKDAGEKTLGWMRETLGIKSAVTTSTAISERTARKQAIDNPASTSARTPTQDDPPQQQNVAASIAEMRTQRVAGGG